jgi:hypothetical protein
MRATQGRRLEGGNACGCIVWVLGVGEDGGWYSVGLGCLLRNGNFQRRTTGLACVAPSDPKRCRSSTTSTRTVREWAKSTANGAVKGVGSVVDRSLYHHKRQAWSISEPRWMGVVRSLTRTAGRARVDVGTVGRRRAVVVTRRRSGQAAG